MSAGIWLIINCQDLSLNILLIRMRMMRIFLVNLLLVVAVSLAACTGRTNEIPAPTEPPVIHEATTVPIAPTETPATQITLEPTAAPTITAACPEGEKILTIWHQWDVQHLESVIAALGDYTDNINPCVEFELFRHEDMTQDLRVAIPAGGGPDIISWSNDQIGNQAMKGHISDLGQLGIDVAYLESNFEPAAAAGVQYDGSIWGLPESQEGIALVYNRDFVPLEYLPTDPMDFAALLEKATAFKESTGKYLICNQAFTSSVGSDAYHAAPVFFGFGIPSYVNDDGVVYLDTAEALAAGEWLASLSAVSDAKASYDICMAGLREADYGMMWTGPWAIAGIEEAGFEYGITPMGKPMVRIKVLLLSKNAVDRANSEAALEVMKYLTSAKLQTRLALDNDIIPAASAALTNPEVASRYAIAEFGKALKLGLPMSTSPYASAQWVPVGQAVAAIWSGSLSPAEALAVAQAAIEAVIAQMK